MLRKVIKPCRSSLYPLEKLKRERSAFQSSPFSVSAFSRNKTKKSIRRRVIRPKKIIPRSSDRKGYSILPEKIPKLLAGPNVIPHLITPPPSPILRNTSIGNSRQVGEGVHQQQSITGIRSSKRFKKWLRENWGVIVLNSGSIATLTAFSRTDILELRLLSIAGSVSTMIYLGSRKPPRIYLPIIWASIFTLTNSYMVYNIYQERKGSLSKPWTEGEKAVYVEHFRSHGITPRQFEKLLSKASRLILPRGSVLVERGSKFESVYLVTNGYMVARSTISRKVTAASSVPGNKTLLAGGDAGAWIGELAFLEKYSNVTSRSQGGVLSHASTVKNTAKVLLKPNHKPEAKKEPEKNFDQNHYTESASIIKPKTAGTALLSYTATQDSVVLEWKHEDLAEILNSSNDMRASLTRAMTAAVVGKVVNLYSSKAIKEEDSNWWKLW